MNKQEKTYRTTGRVLNLLFIAWVVCVGLVFLAPAGIQDSDWRYIATVILIASLFVAIVIIGILKSVAYIRWTGKYPYYFLFRSSRERVNEKQRMSRIM